MKCRVFCWRLAHRCWHPNRWRRTKFNSYILYRGKSEICPGYKPAPGKTVGRLFRQKLKFPAAEPTSPLKGLIFERLQCVCLFGAELYNVWWQTAEKLYIR